jgi:hypothetical protein
MIITYLTRVTCQYLTKEGSKGRRAWHHGFPYLDVHDFK